MLRRNGVDVSGEVEIPGAQTRMAHVLKTESGQRRLAACSTVGAADAAFGTEQVGSLDLGSAAGRSDGNASTPRTEVGSYVAARRADARGPTRRGLALPEGVAYSDGRIPPRSPSLSPTEFSMVDEPSAHEEQSQPDRRGFLGALALTLTGLIAAGFAAVAGAFAFGPAFSRESEAGREGRCSLVPPANFGGDAGPSLHTLTVTSSAGWSEAHVVQAVYLDRGRDGALRAFSARCPHEGCRVNWRAEQGRYVCPCHESSWTRDGERLGGPTKRGLDPLPVQPGPDGRVEVCYRTFALDTAERVEVG
jgi:nitrite reductase/ring-hydroxylating ferredoxin subunit